MSDSHSEWSADLRLHPDAFVAPGATVVGAVTLGARASVWFGTVVRGDTAPITIGADTNLQDLTLVHVDADAPTTVGERVTVGHRAIVHGCTIGDDCLIGMGAIVLSHAVIGAGSLIGAGALVKEGQIIPPGSLALGSPARVIGPVNEAHREAIRVGAIHYAELAHSYRARGFARPFPAPHHPTGVTTLDAGPMTYAEWGRLLGTLAEGPDAVAEHLAAAPAHLTARPDAGRWNALEVIGHLRDADRDVYLPRLERVLTEPAAPVPDVDLERAELVASYDGLDPAAVLTEWRSLRARLLARLAPLGREDWARIGVHSRRGAFPLADMVRGWVEHDLSHRRQLARALGLVP